MCYLFSQMNLFPSHNKPIKVEEGEGSYGQHRNNGGGGGKGGKGGGADWDGARPGWVAWVGMERMKNDEKQ